MRREREVIPKEIRAEVKQKFGGCCAYCGITLKKSFHVDHVIPVAAGGVDDIMNYFPACRECNTVKNSFSLEQFRTILESIPFRGLAVIGERLGMLQIYGPVKVVFHFEKQGHKFDYEVVEAMMYRNR